MIRHQTEFRLKLDQEDECNHKSNHDKVGQESEIDITVCAEHIDLRKMVTMLLSLPLINEKDLKFAYIQYFFRHFFNYVLKTLLELLQRIYPIFQQIY